MLARRLQPHTWKALACSPFAVAESAKASTSRAGGIPVFADRTPDEHMSKVNVNPINAAGRQADNSNPQTSSPTNSRADQAGSVQQFGETQPAHQKSDSVASTSRASEVESPSTMTAGIMRARAIQERERCAASTFVRARAQLAATLAGANVEALRSEIGLAEQQSAQWSNVRESSAGAVDSNAIFDDVVPSSYLRLQRFQNDARHCRPRASQDVSATSHLRDMARLRSRNAPFSRFDYSAPSQPNLARMAADHTAGATYYSPFVSLAEDAGRLPFSPDRFVREIARNATELYTYTVPGLPSGRPKGSSAFFSAGLGAMILAIYCG